jgi:hypothetical protein
MPALTRRRYPERPDCWHCGVIVQVGWLEPAHHRRKVR